MRTKHSDAGSGVDGRACITLPGEEKDHKKPEGKAEGKEQDESLSQAGVARVGLALVHVEHPRRQTDPALQRMLRLLSLR